MQQKIYKNGKNMKKKWQKLYIEKAICRIKKNSDGAQIIIKRFSIQLTFVRDKIR